MIGGKGGGKLMITAILDRRRGARHHAGMTRRWPAVLWWVGLAGHLVMLVWYASTGLVAPLWAVGGLLVIWAVLLVVGLRLRTRRPAWMLLIPVVDVAVWVAVVSAGDRFLDWTA
jgi:hypothetical protein